MFTTIILTIILTILFLIQISIISTMVSDKKYFQLKIEKLEERNKNLYQFKEVIVDYVLPKIGFRNFSKDLFEDVYIGQTLDKSVTDQLIQSNHERVNQIVDFLGVEVKRIPGTPEKVVLVKKEKTSKAK